MHVDISFDFRSDSGGRDPDTASRTLKNYHKVLWSKALPSGNLLRLEEPSSSGYLVFKDNDKDFFLSSDSIGNSYSGRKRLSKLLNQIDPELLSSFRSLNSTIGGYILFPSNRVEGKPTINGERGFHQLIADRFDLTLECIRRLYLGMNSPLSSTLLRYKDFFELFQDFSQYVRFFLLSDLVSDDFSTVLLFNQIPRLFESSPVPDSVSSYLEYRQGVMTFIQNRNKRIQSWAKNGQ